MAAADPGASTSVSNVLKLTSGLQAPRSALKSSSRRTAPTADRQKTNNGPTLSMSPRTVANSSSWYAAQVPPVPSSATVASLPPLVPTAAFEAVMWKHDTTWTRAATLWGLVRSQTASSLPTPQGAEPTAFAATPTPPSVGNRKSSCAKSKGIDNSGSSARSSSSISSTYNVSNSVSLSKSLSLIEDEDSSAVLSTFTEACTLCSAAAPLSSSSHLAQLCASVLPWSTLGFLLAKYSDTDAWHEWPNAVAPLPKGSPAKSKERAAATGHRNYLGANGTPSELLSRRESQSAALALAIDQHDCIIHGAAVKAHRLAKCFGGLDPVVLLME